MDPFTSIELKFYSLFLYLYINVIFNNYSSSPNGLWLRGHEGERNNCFSKIQLVGQKNIKTKHLSQVEARLQSSFIAKTLQIWRHFSLLVGYNI